MKTLATLIGQIRLLSSYGIKLENGIANNDEEMLESLISINKLSQQCINRYSKLTLRVDTEKFQTDVTKNQLLNGIALTHSIAKNKVTFIDEEESKQSKRPLDRYIRLGLLDLNINSNLYNYLVTLNEDDLESYLSVLLKEDE
jgi:hypothetical protein